MWKTLLISYGVCPYLICCLLLEMGWDPMAWCSWIKGMIFVDPKANCFSGSKDGILWLDICGSCTLIIVWAFSKARTLCTLVINHLKTYPLWELDLRIVRRVGSYKKLDNIIDSQLSCNSFMCRILFQCCVCCLQIVSIWVGFCTSHHNYVIKCY